MLHRALFLILFLASSAGAKSSQCLQAEALSADYWAMIHGLVKTLDACGDSMSKPCKIARATDKTIKDREGPNGAALVVLLPTFICKD